MPKNITISHVVDKQTLEYYRQYWITFYNHFNMPVLELGCKYPIIAKAKLGTIKPCNIDKIPNRLLP